MAGYLISEVFSSENNFYVANYCCARCDLCLWNKQYSEAIEYVEQAKEFYANENGETFATRRCNERLKLLEGLNALKLNEEEEIDEIFQKFPDL